MDFESRHQALFSFFVLSKVITFMMTEEFRLYFNLLNKFIQIF